MSVRHAIARQLLADTRGAVMLETLVVILPLIGLFLTLCQVIDGYTHQLLVRRASSAAARAAVVVLPDDGAHYGDSAQRSVNAAVGARKDAIDAAALRVLSASRSFSRRGTSVQLSGRFGPHGFARATVAADYACFLPVVSLFCGADGKLTLTASTSLPYPFAAYQHARGG